MFWLLVEKELRESLRSSKFAVTFGVCSVLILLAFYLGAEGYGSSRGQYEAAVAENLRQMEGQTDWLEVSPSVFLPPAQACELARDDDFTLVGGGPPIVRMHFQIGQINPEIEIRPPTPAGGTEEWLREEEEGWNDDQPG